MPKFLDYNGLVTYHAKTKVGTINSVSRDGDGNYTLTAENVGALHPAEDDDTLNDKIKNDDVLKHALPMELGGNYHTFPTFATQVLNAEGEPLEKDGKLNIPIDVSKQVTAILTAEKWSVVNTTSTEYVQNVAVKDLSVTDKIIVDLDTSDMTSDTADVLLEGYACIDRVIGQNGEIQVSCYAEKPEIDIPLKLLIVR